MEEEKFEMPPPPPPPPPPKYQAPPKDGMPLVFSFVKSCFAVLGCGCFAVLVFFGLLFYGLIQGISEAFEDDEPVITTENVIAVIDVKGVIVSESNVFDTELASAKRICKQIRKAEKDPAVKAILIRLNTPGGEVTASDTVWHTMRSCRKPVVAYIDSMAASGGYYIAVGAKKIVAHRQALTGSIGVIISTWNAHQLLDFIGVEPVLYTSGKMKGMLHPGKESSPEEQQLVQKLVMNSYEDFVNVIAESRQIPAEQIRNTEIGDGRILDSKQALAAKLIDQLGYFEDAVKAAEELAGLSHGAGNVVDYTNKASFKEIFEEFNGFVSQPEVRITVPGANGSHSFRPEPWKAYYLPAGN